MPRAIIFNEFGGPKVLQVSEVPLAEPAADEVRVKIQAFAINPLDVMMRAGNSPSPVALPHARLGIEATGVIDAVGTRVFWLPVGDPVIITAIPDSTARGSYAEYVNLPATAVIPRPAELSVAQAAAVWVAFSTACGSLMEAASVRRGDHVLISGASGAVGRAALQIVERQAATSMAVTRSGAKAAELSAAGASRVISTDSEDLVTAVRNATGDVGADVTLDMVRGPGQADLLRATRAGGTLIASGFLDSRPTPPPLDDSVTVVNYHGFSYLADPAAVARMAEFLAEGVAQGALMPRVDRIFGFDQIVQAHEYFDSGAAQGKVVVTVE